MKQERYDVVVIGSGMGGMCAASLLAHADYKTLVVEQLPQIGGRFSTIEYKGFKITTGALMVAVGGTVNNIFDEVGAEFELSPLGLEGYLVDGKMFQPELEKGYFRSLLTQLCGNETEPTKIMAAFRRARTWEMPSNQLSFRDWLLQCTENEDVLAYFRNYCPYALVANDHEASARAYFDLQNRIKGILGLGIPPEGNIRLMESLAKVIRAKGSDVWTRCKAKRILVIDGIVKGVMIEGKEKEEVEITAKAVVSNAGPKKTVQLAGSETFDRGYLREVGNLRPGCLINIAIASDRPLHETPVLRTLKTRRMLDFTVATSACPELAPRGKHLHFSYSSPETMVGPWDLQKEVDLHVQDLRENIPAFDRYGEILHVAHYSGDWPVYHNIPFVGYIPVSEKTPVQNLYNVGDGVLFGGTGSCAETARTVVEDIKKRLKPGEA